MQALAKAKADKLVELKGLNDLIAERKKYHRDQEFLINDLIESGNTQLMTLNHDILLAKQMLRDIKTDVRTAAQDKVLLNEDLVVMRGEAEMLVVRTTFFGFAPSFG